MSLNFQPYQDTAGQEIRKRWGSSIEDIFNQYQASKQQAEKERQASAGSILQNGFDVTQTSPEQIQAAYAQYLAQKNAQNMPATTAAPGVPSQTVPATSPIVPQSMVPQQAGVQGLMAQQSPQQFSQNLQMPGAAQDVQSPAIPPTPGSEPTHQLHTPLMDYFAKRDAASKMQSDLVQSEASKNNAEAWSKLNPQLHAGGGVQLTPIQLSALQWGMNQGIVSSEDINSRGPRSIVMADGIAGRPDFKAYYDNVQKTGDTGLSNFNPQENKIKTKSAVAYAESGARLSGGGSAQMTARTANAASAQLDILKQVSDQFPRSDIQFMNTPIIAMDKQKNPQAQNWIFAVNSFRNEYASALMRGNMPQQQAMAEVSRAVPDNITPMQLDSLIPLARRELDALVQGQMTPAGASGPRSTPNRSNDPAEIIRSMSAAGKSRDEIKAALKSAGH